MLHIATVDFTSSTVHSYVDSVPLMFLIDCCIAQGDNTIFILYVKCKHHKIIENVENVINNCIGSLNITNYSAFKVFFIKLWSKFKNLQEKEHCITLRQTNKLQLYFWTRICPVGNLQTINIKGFKYKFGENTFQENQRHGFLGGNS